MLNFNGNLVNEDSLQLSHKNRGFLYGDALFETIKVRSSKIVFWEDHYFRLMASMRMIRMKIPMKFTLEFLEEEILKTTNSLEKSDFYRVRLNVFRKDGGYYTPETNEIDFLIEASPLSLQEKKSYKIDLFKDFYVFSGYLSTIKSNNKLVNTLSAIFAKDNDLDNCVLLNERKGIAEVSNGNIFLVKDNIIKTPSLEEGCLKGIIRGKVLKILEKHKDFEVQETSITPFEIQKADEVFITNAILGIQPVTKYRKKEFVINFSKKLAAELNVIEITS